MIQSSVSNLPRLARIALPPLAGLSVLGWGIAHMPPEALSQAVSGLPDIPLWRWVAALIMTACSFAAMGRMEGLWHVALRLGTQPYAARRTGRVAIAMGQFLGAASVVAALVRWRMLFRSASAFDVSRLSVAASISFMVCWAVPAVAALWWLAEMQLLGLSPYALPIFLSVAAAGVWRYGGLIRGRGGLALGVLGWTLCDLLFAGGAFYLLLPAHVPLIDVLAVFMLAVGAGLVSHVPLGLGAFDLIVVTLLPVPAASLFPALLAYRIVYIVIPGLSGLAAFSRPQSLPTRAAIRHLLKTRAPALWALSAQGASIWQKGDAAALVGHAPLAQVVIGDVVGPDLPELSQTARYKCGARTAAALRRDGWSVLRIAQEACLDPRTWSTSGSARSGLRRKLRQAEAAGVRIAILSGDLPLHRIARIARDWSLAHNGELGFSMSRYSAQALAGQAIFGIYIKEELRGFISFQTGPHDWCLDLIRHGDKLPSGAIPAAIVAAIDAARDAGVPRLSLAAVPATSGPVGWMVRNKSGLSQFKRSFAPHWQPLYHAAPNAVTLAATLASVTWAVHRPVGRLTDLAWQLCFPAPHASQGPTVRTGRMPDTGVTHDTSFRKTSRLARLDPRRWRDRHKPVQHGSFFRRRPRDVEHRAP